MDYISICTNPNIVLFFLLGASSDFSSIVLPNSKLKLTPIIHKYWHDIGKSKEYKASSWQLEIIKNSFIFEQYDYENIIKNSSQLSNNYLKDNPASNLPDLLNALKDGNTEFFNNAVNVKKAKDF